MSDSRLRAALDKVRAAKRPDGGRDKGPGGRYEAVAQALAQALGVDVDRVKTALNRIEADHRARHDRARAQHAAALARELGLPAKKVTDALASLPHPGPHGPGRGGPPPGR